MIPLGRQEYTLLEARRIPLGNGEGTHSTTKRASLGHQECMLSMAKSVYSPETKRHTLLATKRAVSAGL
jgi:hypothetical protein